jgi:hypothetical protein
MRIVDFREDYEHEPSLESIEAAISLIPPDSLVGIRELRLYDDDPRSNNHTPAAYARYVHNKRLRHADIELYFWRLGELEEALRENHMYVLFLLIRSFSHELYHHKLGAQRKSRKPKKHIEEDRADGYAQHLASQVINQLFPRKKNRALWRSMEKVVRTPSSERDSA